MTKYYQILTWIEGLTIDDIFAGCKKICLCLDLKNGRKELF